MDESEGEVEVGGRIAVSFAGSISDSQPSTSSFPLHAQPVALSTFKLTSDRFDVPARLHPLTLALNRHSYRSLAACAHQPQALLLPSRSGLAFVLHELCWKISVRRTATNSGAQRRCERMRGSMSIEPHRLELL